MIYDGDQKRVLAARDAAGSQPLHWGVTDDGRFMFGSCADDLIDCNPTATPFPAGGFYLISLAQDVCFSLAFFDPPAHTWEPAPSLA